MYVIFGFSSRSHIVIYIELARSLNRDGNFGDTVAETYLWVLSVDESALRLEKVEKKYI